MHDLDTIAAHCGILVETATEGGFRHLATAWSVGPGEWVTAWAAAEAPGPTTRLLNVQDGSQAPLTDWECDEGVAGFTSALSSSHLSTAGDKALRKRDQLWALGFPDLIEHPSQRLHRGSLTAERYFPYLCPWVIAGHLGLFTSHDGYLTGRFYAGMAGGPVLDVQGRVVGLLLDGDAAPECPPLTRFRRLA